jgi:signal transduction histidine kinase
MPMLFTAGGGLITELISLSLLYKAQKTNFNIKGAHWHVLQTFAGSPIIIVAALTIWFTDFLETDPLLGMPFGLLLLGASWAIIRAALYILLDNVPRDLDLMNEAQSAIEAALMAWTAFITFTPGALLKERISCQHMCWCATSERQSIRPKVFRPCSNQISKCISPRSSWSQRYTRKLKKRKRSIFCGNSPIGFDGGRGGYTTLPG